MYSLVAAVVGQQQLCAYGKPQCLARDAASSARSALLLPHPATFQNIVSHSESKRETEGEGWGGGVGGGERDVYMTVYLCVPLPSFFPTSLFYFLVASWTKTEH